MLWSTYSFFFLKAFYCTFLSMKVQCYIQWIYIAPPCITLRLKTWAYFNPKWNDFQKLFNCKRNFLMRTLQYFLKKIQLLFLLTKSWKNHPQKLLRKPHIHFFFLYCPELPKRPRLKNSCSKLWFIDQLYIKLGMKVLATSSFLQIFSSYLFVKFHAYNKGDYMGGNFW